MGVWKVSYSIRKNRAGYYENGGECYFKTIEEAKDFIENFKKYNSGWTSAISEPIEILEVMEESIRKREACYM